MEETVTKLSEGLLFTKEAFNSSISDHNGHSHHRKTEFKTIVEEERMMFSSILVKLEFSWFSGNDSIEWNGLNQFFGCQATLAVQKNFSLASFHLEGEANQW